MHSGDIRPIFVIHGMVLCAIVGWPVGIAAAGPVTYIESVHGDLPMFGGPVLILDIGTNSVSGRFGSDGDADFDSFVFAVPPGAQLVAGQVVLDDAVGDIHDGFWQLGEGLFSHFGATVLQFLSPTSPGIATINAPLGTGDYNLAHLSFGSGGVVPSFADYTFTFELVSAVPEPASVALTIIGSAMLLFTRRGPGRILRRTTTCEFPRRRFSDSAARRGDHHDFVLDAGHDGSNAVRAV